MTEDDFRDWLDSLLRPLEFVVENGAESQNPKIDILGYYVRRIRISPIPILGRGLSVVAVCRTPEDVSRAANGCYSIIERLGIVANSQFPPIRKGRGLTVGITAIVLTDSPITASDDTVLAEALNPVPKTRVVPLGIIRVNLEQEAVGFALKRGPEGLFPETDVLTTAFTERFRRFLPLVELS